MASNVQFEEASAREAISDLSNGKLDEQVKSLMEKGKNMCPSGNQANNGTPGQTTTGICKVCGKEGRPTNIKNHIEMTHLEGISIPCSFCEKVCTSRQALRMHKRYNHKDVL